jgi:hypothetical protein
MASALLRVIFIMARGAQRAAIPDIIPKLREFVRVLDMMRYGCFRPPSIPRAFLTEISGTA